MLLPTKRLVALVDKVSDEFSAELVVLDPALPLGLIGSRLSRPYAVVVHGAEVTVPGRLPVLAKLLRRVVDGASLVVAAGSYPLTEVTRVASRELRFVVVPPGVDASRFHPLDEAGRLEARDRLGLARDAFVVASVSRLVPRKGMDVLIEAAARLGGEFPDLVVAIAGEGRDRARLERLQRRLSAPVRFLGALDEDLLPLLYASSDLFAMLCRDRWLGLEREGFGIVFLEAAACGIAQLAGRSGGVRDAVRSGATGKIVDRPADLAEASNALASLVSDEDLRVAFGREALARVRAQFDYNTLTKSLVAALEDCVA